MCTAVRCGRVVGCDNAGMTRFIFRLAGNMFGIWISARVVDGIRVDEGTSVGETLLILAGIALVFTLVNSLVRPLVKVIGFPLYVITFGLFALVTNAIVFGVTGWAADLLGMPLHVANFGSALLGGTITAIISAIVVALFGRETRGADRR